MLTTETSSKIAANVATDVNANVVDPKAPRQHVLSPEAAILFDKAIIARSLATPEVCNIHVKNTDYYYRWVFAEGKGRTYMQRKAMGFVNATCDDVDILVGDAVATAGEVRSGDLILMKMQYGRWAQHVKANMERARILGNTRGMYNKNDAPTDVFSNEEPVRETVTQDPHTRTMARPFIPENPEALVNDSIKSGRVNRAIERDQEIRSKIQQEGGK